MAMTYDSMASDATADAIIELSELINENGHSSDVVQAFICKHESLPDFRSLAEQTIRLEQQFDRTWENENASEYSSQVTKSSSPEKASNGEQGFWHVLRTIANRPDLILGTAVLAVVLFLAAPQFGWINQASKTDQLPVLSSQELNEHLSAAQQITEQADFLNRKLVDASALAAESTAQLQSANEVYQKVAKLKTELAELQKTLKRAAAPDAAIERERAERMYAITKRLLSTGSLDQPAKISSNEVQMFIQDAVALEGQATPQLIELQAMVSAKKWNDPEFWDNGKERVVMAAHSGGVKTPGSTNWMSDLMKIFSQETPSAVLPCADPGHFGPGSESIAEIDKSKIPETRVMSVPVPLNSDDKDKRN